MFTEVPAEAATIASRMSRKRRFDDDSDEDDETSKWLKIEAKCVDSEGDDECIDMNQSADSTSSPTSNAKFRTFRNHLMMSQWLVDVPADFATHWLVVPCPVGKRCLVVAGQGRTRAFQRNGYCIKSNFPSRLPGGNRRDQARHKESCMLDCIYNSQSKTFYILDLLAWNGM